jgi:cytochrome c biogenesis protein CcmG/thiol:disulfide interchange protein DsbE
MHKPVQYLSLAVLFLSLMIVWLASAYYFRADVQPAVTQPAWGEPAPMFSLARLDNPQVLNSPQDWLGDVYLLNYWASWCVSCKQEHAYLMELARRGIVIYSVNYRDKPDAAQAVLANTGNPYRATVVDKNGDTARDYGIIGTPITFVVDKTGKIRYKHVGALNAQVFDDIIEPLIQAL